MGGEYCELCGYRGEARLMEKCHTIPVAVTESAGVAESRIITLCQNCHRELDKWYSVKVADTGFDSNLNRFRPKTPQEMVGEYEFALAMFEKYKGKQKKVA